MTSECKFELDGLTYQIEIFTYNDISYIGVVSKNACCADVSYATKMLLSRARNVENAVKNGRIKLQYTNEEFSGIKCEYEYETYGLLEKDTFRANQSCADPKQLIKKQKEYNALVLENAKLKSENNTLEPNPTAISRAREFYIKYTTEIRDKPLSDEEFDKILKTPVSESKKPLQNLPQNSKPLQNNENRCLEHMDNSILDNYIDNAIISLARGAAKRNMEMTDYIKKLSLAMEGKLESHENVIMIATHITSQIPEEELLKYNS
jgi:hypothetical protein